MSEVRVAMCGLFCGNCGKFKRNKCQGCVLQPGYSRCSIRACVLEKGYVTCAECDELEGCKKLNNFISKVFKLIFRSDRNASLCMIQREGMEAFIQYKVDQGKM